MSDCEDSPGPGSSPRGSTATQDALNTYFQRSATLIRHVFKRAETRVVQPAFAYALEKFQDRPVLTTFATISALFGFFPIISFLGASLFVLSSCLFIGLAIALTTSSVIITFFTSILLLTLTSLLAIAGALTAGGTSLYLTLRFGTLLTTNTHDLSGLRTTLAQWWAETIPLFALHAPSGGKDVTTGPAADSTDASWSHLNKLVTPELEEPQQPGDEWREHRFGSDRPTRPRLSARSSVAATPKLVEEKKSAPLLEIKHEELETVSVRSSVAGDTASF